MIDVYLSEMNGYELAGQLAGGAPAAPIILITAHLEERDRWRQMSPQAVVGLLLKPIVEEELIATLRMALGKEAWGASEQLRRL